MQLVCPKCNAQYNVADNAIPQGGRDVQCSGCGNTWFQTEKPKKVSREVSRILSTPLPSVVKSMSSEVSAYDTPHGGNARSEGAMHVPVSDAPQHRKMAPNVANILREEAALSRGISDHTAAEAVARRQSNSADIAETRKRIAQLTTGAVDISAGNSPAGVQPDPHAIPDVNEINAALRTRSQANVSSGVTEVEKHEAVRRRGFRRGFFIVLIAIALILAPYIYAEQIVENMPELRGYMATYVAIIDEMRLSLNAMVDAASVAIADLMA
jgi:predicted Zn finger-like uncharacterized protein